MNRLVKLRQMYDTMTKDEQAYVDAKTPEELADAHSRVSASAAAYKQEMLDAKRLLAGRGLDHGTAAQRRDSDRVLANADKVAQQADAAPDGGRVNPIEALQDLVRQPKEFKDDHVPAGEKDGGVLRLEGTLELIGDKANIEADANVDGTE